MLLPDLADRHQTDRIRLGHALAGRVTRFWRQIPIDDLEGGWTAVAPLMAQQVIAAQRATVDAVAPFMASVDAAYGVTPVRAELDLDVLTNVMGDGREIAPALYTAVTATKRLVGGGMAPARAFETAANLLALIARSGLHDIGRNADNALAIGKTYTRYIRIVNAGACSRCAILAGARSGAVAFKRHKGCQCSSMPYQVGGKPTRGFFDNPSKYFESLSRGEQDRVFGEASAHAIREGADISKVVNARRGAYTATLGARPDGTPLNVLATTEGTTRRGEFGKANALRSTSIIRLMPEQIQLMANGDPTRYADLLHRYGYLR